MTPWDAGLSVVAVQYNTKVILQCKKNLDTIRQFFTKQYVIVLKNN
jgi:hypothetical protein